MYGRPVLGWLQINFFLINNENEGRRLDNFLFSKFKKGIPKSKIYSSIRKAKIKVNGRKTRPDYKLNVGDKVGYPELVQKSDIDSSPNLNTHLTLIKDSIIYDSTNFLVINNRDKNSTLPIIIKNIRKYLVKKCKF